MPRAKKVLTIEERVDKIGELLESIAKEARIWRHVKQQAVEPQGVTVPAAPKAPRKKVVKAGVGILDPTAGNSGKEGNP